MPLSEGTLAWEHGERLMLWLGLLLKVYDSEAP